MQVRGLVFFVSISTHSELSLLQCITAKEKRREYQSINQNSLIIAVSLSLFLPLRDTENV